MPNDNLKNYLHLHLLVFIAGFTAVLGKLITINAIPLVWFRMLIASLLISVYLKVNKTDLKINKNTFIKFSLAGILIALHWITFFEAINQSNISITLAMFSSGAFFAALIEPIFYKRRIVWYEMVFGLIVIIGVYLIVQAEVKYINGIILGLLSALFSSLFSVINGKFVERYKASVISFYELMSGAFFITLFILIFGDGFNKNYFNISFSDWTYIFILGSVCTAYAFIAAVHVMKKISPYTVILTYNLEPVYGILMALLLFQEKMSSEFYIGAILIISTIVFNGILKNSNKLKRKISK